MQTPTNRVGSMNGPRITAIKIGRHVVLLPTKCPGLEKISGEGGFSSDNPDMVAANPKVVRMEFRFRADEKLPDCIMALVKADKVEGKMTVRKMTINGVDHYWLGNLKFRFSIC